MGGSEKKPQGGRVERRPDVHRRDAALVLGLVALAFATAAAVVATRVRDTDPEPPREMAAPDCLVPERVPYEDLLYGEFRELGDGRIELFYDFDPLPRVEGARFTDADLYVQLRDWNTSLEGSKARTGVVRGEGRLSGEARTRVAFEGPLEVRLELELVKGTAAIQIATNTAGEGYECLISSEGEVRLRSRLVVTPEEEGFDDIATLSEGQKRRRREEIVRDLAGPARIAPPARRRLRVAFVRGEDALSVEVDGARVLEAPLPEPDPRTEGNVALRLPVGLALWDDVRISGRLSRNWLEERMDMATRLTGGDYYESDDVWPMARELAADGREQARSLAPAGDVDWISVAAPSGAAEVVLETRGLELGIDTEIDLFELDGVTPLECRREDAGEPGAARLVVAADGPRGRRVAFYARVTEPEGRCGMYRILAAPLSPPDGR